MRPIAIISALVLLSISTHATARTPKRAQAEASKVASLALKDEARQVAEAYLNALSGKGDATARSYLLGGMTFTAEDAKIPNWKIARREAPVVEKAFLAPAIKHMHDLDHAGASALARLLDASNPKVAFSQKQAKILLASTRREVASFQHEHSLFARMARVGKAIYWHAHNPWRMLVESIDQSGQYQLELHVFRIQETGKKGTRTWPLRVLRFKTDHLDSGWKILPASDWDPDF